MVAKYKINGKCGTGPLKSNSGTLCLLTMICQPRSMVRANLLNNSFGPVLLMITASLIQVACRLGLPLLCPIYSIIRRAVSDLLSMVWYSRV